MGWLILASHYNQRWACDKRWAATAYYWQLSPNGLRRSWGNRPVIRYSTVITMLLFLLNPFSLTKIIPFPFPTSQLNLCITDFAHRTIHGFWGSTTDFQFWPSCVNGSPQWSGAIKPLICRLHRMSISAVFCSSVGPMNSQCLMAKLGSCNMGLTWNDYIDWFVDGSCVCGGYQVYAYMLYNHCWHIRSHHAHRKDSSTNESVWLNHVRQLVRCFLPCKTDTFLPVSPTKTYVFAVGLPHFGCALAFATCLVPIKQQ